jgi:hypothetical protein
MFDYGNFMDPNGLLDHRVTKLNNFIGGFYIPKKSELICDLLKEIHESDPSKTSEEVMDENGKPLKTSEDCYIIDRDITQEVKLILQKAITNYVRKYPLAGGAEMTIHERMKIRKYDKDTTLKSWKIDYISKQEVVASRHISFMVFLNTIEDARVNFLHQNIGIAPEKGLMLLYPSGWMFANMCESLTEPMYVLTGHIAIADKTKQLTNDVVDLTQFHYETE